MQFPCEILVKSILPAIRAIMVRELYQTYKIQQKEISKLLGITQPSVSYYLHGERGGKAVNIIKSKTKETYDYILQLVKKLVNSEITTEEILKEICTICMNVRPVYIQEVCPDKFKFLNEWQMCFKEQD